MSFIANDLVKFEEYEIDRARWQLSWRNEPPAAQSEDL